jgi:tetratricopeptide (TPR) repeat protein
MSRLISLGFTCLLVLSLCVGCAPNEEAHEAAVDLTALLSGIRVVELEEAALEVVKILEAKDFPQVDAILRNLRDNRVLTSDGFSAYDIILERLCDNLAMEALVSDWLIEDPDNSMPHLLRGAWMITAAWSQRGGGFAGTVTEDGWIGFGGHLEQASISLQHAYQLDPQELLACSKMLSVSMAILDDATLNHWFQRAIEIDPNYWNAYSRKAWAMYPRWGGNEAELIVFLNASKQIDPRFGAIKLSWLRDERGSETKRAGSSELAEAKEIVANIRTAFPESGSALRRDAELHYFIGEKEKALELSRLSAELDPSSVNSYGYAYYLYKADRFNEALVHAVVATRLDPHEEDYWRLVARIHHYGLYNYETAIENYTMAIELKAGQEVTLRKRGDLYLRLSRFDEAMADYLTALEGDPYYGRAYYGIGRVFHYQGDQKKAEEAFQKAIEVDPDMQTKIDDFLHR